MSAEAKPKKTRRPLRHETASSKTEGSDAKRAKVEKNAQPVQERPLFYAEEDSILEQDLETDEKVHKMACQEIHKCMDDIKSLKESGDPTAAAEIAENRIHGSLQFLTLKRLNRIAHLRCKKVRDDTSEAKGNIDKYHLQLQNLLYEVMHLQKEITKCLEFKSKDEEIELVPEEQFYKEAPSDIAKPDVTKKNPHQRMKARLDWELAQRKQLAEQLRTTEESKDVISSDMKKKKEYLESLQPKLSAILQSTKPVQEYLGMRFDEVREQHRTAAHLPEPLYVLYMQATAYHEACDKNMSVSISGDIEAAKNLETEKPPENVEDSDSDQEEDSHKKKSKHRRRTMGDHMSLKRQKALKKHPLSVMIVIKCKDGSRLQMTFYYLLTLEIITMTMTLDKEDTSSYSTISGGDLLSSDSLLACLYPGDYGDDTPNSSNRYTLHSLGMADFASYISELGRPYVWAQWLAGLQFMAGSEVRHALSSLSASHMGETIQRIRRRIQARLSLQKQLAALENGSVVIAKEIAHLFPAKICSKLVSWKRTTYEDLKVLPYTTALFTANNVHETDMFYTAQFSRGSATMTSHVVISPNYPNTVPLFAVSIQWKGGEKTSLTGTDIRELEAEVNIHHKDLLAAGSADQILTNQIQRLLMCLDVYLETDSASADLEGPNEFPMEKMFPFTSRGPLRSKPYKYNYQLGYFCQR